MHDDAPHPGAGLPAGVPPGPHAARRADALTALGASPAAVRELLAYTASPLLDSPLPPLPLAPEPGAAAWRTWGVCAARSGDPARWLQAHVVPLQFPVGAGVSASTLWRAAVVEGEEAAAPMPAAWPPFADPTGVRLFVHDTPVGPLPVLVARDRGDFERLVRSLAHRNEPVPIPPAQGACMVTGRFPWLRAAAAQRRRGLARAGAALPPHAALADRGRGRDRLAILSEGAYSGVPATQLGRDATEWRGRSFRIRLAHEAAHYVTARLFGSSRNALPDELLADWYGLTESDDPRARRTYDAPLARHVLGLSPRGDRLRDDGRLHAYRGTPALSDEAFALLVTLAARAIDTLATFDLVRARAADAATDGLEVLIALARTPVELLATDDALSRLHSAHRAARRALRAATLQGQRSTRAIAWPGTGPALAPDGDIGDPRDVGPAAADRPDRPDRPDAPRIDAPTDGGSAGTASSQTAPSRDARTDARTDVRGTAARSAPTLPRLARGAAASASALVAGLLPLAAQTLRAGGRSNG